MDFQTAIKLAISALLRNKSRTFLTMLGIIIGVGAVIAMVSVGRGAQVSAQQNIESSGTNLIIISSASNFRGPLQGGASTTNPLTLGDVEAIRSQARYISEITPSVRSGVRLIYRNNNWSSSLMGGNEDFFTIRNWKIQKGRIFTKSEVESKMKVAVIGSIVKDELFGTSDPIGEIIRINKISFRVIGVMEEKGQSGFHGSHDDIIVIPYTTALQRIYRRPGIPIMFASAIRMEDSNRAREEIRSILRQRHHLREGMDDDFNIRTQEDWQQASNESNQVFTILLGAIASVSLLVGGVGIMNIMLVSVTERVREIGIRMAIGARQRDILVQFIIEAVVLSCTGGVLGVIFGVVGASVITAITKFPTSISSDSVILSMGFSGAIGVFFGFYPAWKASKLDPIEALRGG